MKYQRWKKLTNQHWLNFQSEKFAHKICAKNAQNLAKMSKNAINCTKRQKTLKTA